MYLLNLKQPKRALNFSLIFKQEFYCFSSICPLNFLLDLLRSVEKRINLISVLDAGFLYLMTKDKA